MTAEEFPGLGEVDVQLLCLWLQLATGHYSLAMASAETWSNEILERIPPTPIKQWLSEFRPCLSIGDVEAMRKNGAL